MDQMSTNMIRAIESGKPPVMVTTTIKGQGVFVVALIHKAKNGKLPDIHIHQPVRNTRLITMDRIL